MTRRPLFLILAAWIAGILAADVSPSELLVPEVIVLAGLALAAAALSKSRVWLLFLFLAIAFAATVRTGQQANPSAINLSRFESRKSVEVVGVVVSDPDVASGRTRFRIRAEAIRRYSQPTAAEGVAEVVVHQTLGWRMGYDINYGDEVQVTARLTQLSAAANPGEISARDFFAGRGISTVLAVFRPDGIIDLGPASDNPESLPLAAKHSLQTALSQTLPSLHADILSGVLLGQRAILPENLQDDLVTTGLAHILTLSGLHIAALAWMLNALLQAGGLRNRRLRALLMILLVASVTVMAGGRPAVARAALMTGLFFAADLFDREYDLANALLLAALVLLVLNPLQLLDEGFQLSCLAVTGVLLARGPLYNTLSDLAGRFFREEVPPGVQAGLQAASVSIVVWAATAPLLAHMYGTLSLIAPVANIPTVPFAGLLTWCAVLQAMIGSVSVAVGQVTGVMASALVDVFLGLVSLFAQVPGASMVVSEPSSLSIWTAYLAAFLALRPWRLEAP